MILWNGVLISMFRISFQIFLRSFSVKLIISSCVTNDISKSSCVNSGCRSDLRSSSRMHLAIWKYFSKPATIRSCLKSWGDCGRAKNFPCCVRDGTM